MRKMDWRSKKKEDEFKSLLEAKVYPLDDELMNKLVAMGYRRKYLELYKFFELGYCPERESFISLEVHFEEC
jgi:hypothetical protein